MHPDPTREWVLISQSSLNSLKCSQFLPNTMLKKLVAYSWLLCLVAFQQELFTKKAQPKWVRGSTRRSVAYIEGRWGCIQSSSSVLLFPASPRACILACFFHHVSEIPVFYCSTPRTFPLLLSFLSTAIWLGVPLFSCSDIYRKDL